ncbi:MAG: squalene--hopene cyclase [Rhodospirillaceae bacterium]|nr:squalene--hopene cyclase [Rhodospirillaceae bacterium]
MSVMTGHKVGRERLDQLIANASAGLLGRQQGDGHWVFPLEADSTIPAEYVMLRHYLGDPDPALEARIAKYLRRRRTAEGGWPLYHDGDFNISASVKAYYALKLIGDDPDAPHMAEARAAILAHGGAARANVFTRFTLALFGQVPWRGVPLMPVEVMLLPRWFPFHMSKVSYWSRTVIVPLVILNALKPVARNPRGVDIRELFTVPPERERRFITNPTGSVVGGLFLALDKVLHVLEPAVPKGIRRRAIDRAVAFARERMNGDEGLGGIYPAMANLVMAFDALGYPRDHPEVAKALAAIEKLVVFGDDEDGEVFVQPCPSPVWDTGLAMHALLDAGVEAGDARLRAAAKWLRDRQILDHVGDWALRRPGVRPGGWAFEYDNDDYPDVDDTALIGMALHRLDAESNSEDNKEAIARAAEWVIGMQSKNGGWGAFDADNTHSYLNHIPFADHGALLDPPTADVTARCLGFLTQIGHGRDHPAVARALDYLRREQEPDGSWFGRWGTNYVYGTWSVVTALNAAGEDMQAEHIRRAVDWLKSRQQPDGGWGEDGASYWTERKDEVKASTPSQTAWAVLALLAAGEVDSDAVTRGIAFLEAHPREADGVRWQEDLFTAVGFPRVFYLRYHGYASYFPLWAVGRYRSLMDKNDRRVAWGI